ncbi:MAG: dienelactone hydrolase family protein [Candidatus Rokubacteria bacterium]|nr:dienelactone hydrolase family protein [Candidatus Rokubacteria bacterium]MBI3826292.1 dienelactone hydrolase family protein [Candidatus Rokubacteria bacterium]
MARWETITVDGQLMRVYLDAPAGARRAPAVVVIQHGPGVDRFIHDRVERLAAHGYVAAAPDLYHRQPPDGDMLTRIGRLHDPEVVADVDATVAHLRGRREPEVAHVGIIGFCMGGRVTYLMAVSRPDTFRAAGVFYGGNIMKPWGEGPAPFDLSAKIACPVAGFFGAEDANPSPDDVRKIDAELSRLGKPHEFHAYAGAGHAFLNFTNPATYRESQAADAWDKALAFLARHLQGAR